MSIQTEVLAVADVGGTTSKLALFTTDGTLIRKWEIPSDVSDHGCRILPDICRSLKEQAGDAAIKAAAMGVPGAVDENGVVPVCVNIGWGRVDLKQTVSRLLPETEILRFGNDATLAALGELWRGAAAEHRSAFLFTLGTGIGGGYARQGNVLNGAHGAAAEVGHLTMNHRETLLCNCGKCGCLEQYCSANGIVRLAKNLLEIRSGERTGNSLHVETMVNLEIPEGKSALEAMNRFTAKEICSLAEEGEEFSAYVLELWGRIMGLAMSHVSCCFDPEMFVLGGGMSRAGQILIDAVKGAFRKYAFPPSKETGVILARLGNDAGIYGCARLLLDALDLSGTIC